ncbi:DUF1080 domain-containing protein [Phenylobacterium sp.]|jgi:hypothetical protein|uniref:3-keto-disaccharide hydrolase n=1 Tax=Phenylobacterium sp. TaxID=1871053 RepID=UPI002F420414
MKPVVLGLGLALLASAAFAQAPNTLTAAEKAGGWKLLFDGKDLAGWKGFKTDKPDAGWTVKDGVLGPTKGVSKDIVTKQNYENFDLTFDWKISPLGNSGVMYHVIPVGDETYESGPEYQLLDNAHGEQPLEQAAAAYYLFAPSKDMTKPVGEWNHGRIVVDHGKVQHWLNGVKVVEYDLNSQAFKDRVAATKFKRWPQFGTGKSGAIALQMHGNPVWFENIKIKVLK